VLGFIRSQIKLFDDFLASEAAENATEPETTSKKYVCGLEGSRYLELEGTGHATILGSKQKVSTIVKVLEERSEDAAFTSFCSRTSQAIQALNSMSTDAIAINDLHQVRTFISLMSCSINQMFTSDNFRSDHRVSFHQGRIRVTNRLEHQNRLSTLQSTVLWASTVRFCDHKPFARMYICTTCLCLHMPGRRARLPPRTGSAIGEVVPVQCEADRQGSVNFPMADPSSDQVRGDSA
jgi:hypothetical protein